MTLPRATCRKLLHLFGAAAKILSVASLDLDYVSVVGDIWSLPRCMDRRWFRPPADHFGDLTTKVPVLKSKTPDVTSAERFLVLPSLEGWQTQLCPPPRAPVKKKIAARFFV